MPRCTMHAHGTGKASGCGSSTSRVVLEFPYGKTPISGHRNWSFILLVLEGQPAVPTGIVAWLPHLTTFIPNLIGYVWPVLILFLLTSETQQDKKGYQASPRNEDKPEPHIHKQFPDYLRQ